MSSWGTRRTSSTPTFLKQTKEHQSTQKNTRSPSFQPCSSNKNIQNQGQSSNSNQFPRRGHNFTCQGLMVSNSASCNSFSAAKDGWMDKLRRRCFSRVTKWQSGDFWWKITRVSGFQQKCWRCFILVDITCLLYVIPSYLGIWTGACSSFVSHRSEIGG